MLAMSKVDGIAHQEISRPQKEPIQDILEPAPYNDDWTFARPGMWHIKDKQVCFLSAGQMGTSYVHVLHPFGYWTCQIDMHNSQVVTEYSCYRYTSMQEAILLELL